jgi:hypothetical protein
VGSSDQPEEVQIDWPDMEKPLDRPSGKAYKIVIKREPIPIIVLPGIMGTRLRESGGKGKRVWDPDDLGFMFRTHGTKLATAYKKQRKVLGPKGVYDPGYLKVDEADDQHNDECFGQTVGVGTPISWSRGTAHYASYAPRYPDGAKRGWGGVVWDAYQNVLVGLHGREWSRDVKTCFTLPVYAVGYDWRGSIKASGQYLADRVRKIKSDNPGCKKVILITHSMGGLVARSACNAGLESDVLGVIHTVQPVTGAPAAFWRMKAGFERGHGDTWLKRVKSYPTAWVLGASGLEVTALLGHMPGGLEMLPNMTHQDNDNNPGWLIYQPPMPAASIRVPRSGDPYGEIYRNETDPWRLVVWKEYLAGYRDPSPAEIGSAWADFLMCIGNAQAVHRGLGAYQHPKSWHFYGVGRTTVNNVTFTGDVIDTTLTVIDPLNGIMVGSGFPPVLENGEFSYAEATGENTAIWYKMSEPDGDGDSTVVRSSGKILTIGGAPGIALPGSGHDTCFNDNDIVGSSDLSNNIANIIEGLCSDKIKAEMNK